MTKNTTLPKIAIAKVRGDIHTRACVVTPEDKGYLVVATGEWIEAHKVEIIHWLAVIDPEDAETVNRLWGGSYGDLCTALREIANPTPPLPEEPPIRSFWRDKDGDEWVRRSDGYWQRLTDANDPTEKHTAILTRWWKGLNEHFGPGDVIEP